MALPDAILGSDSLRANGCANASSSETATALLKHERHATTKLKNYYKNMQRTSSGSGSEASRAVPGEGGTSRAGTASGSWNGPLDRGGINGCVTSSPMAASLRAPMAADDELDFPAPVAEDDEVDEFRALMAADDELDLSAPMAADDELDCFCANGCRR